MTAPLSHVDEFTYPLHYGWLDTAACIDWLQAH